jgi:hypothetical protein
MLYGERALEGLAMDSISNAFHVLLANNVPHDGQLFSAPVRWSSAPMRNSSSHSGQVTEFSSEKHASHEVQVAARVPQTGHSKMTFELYSSAIIDSMNCWNSN